MTQGLKDIQAKLKGGAQLTEQMTDEIRKEVSALNGETLIMTLYSGNNVVRFMVPSAAPTSAGSIGKYSEGTDANLSVAMQTALAGLNS